MYGIMNVLANIIGATLLLSVSGRDTNALSNNPKDSWLTGIKGGQNISITQRPYVLSLITEDQGYFLGAGALLNKRWAITAAYTVNGSSEVHVRAGSDNAQSGGTIYNVSKIVTHPKYTGDWRSDLALVKLSTPITFNNKVKPITLAKRLPRPGAGSIVAGYGSTTYSLETDGALRQAVVPYIPYKSCKSKYNSTQASFTPLSFCASKAGVGPCPMDFGAPLTYKGQLYGVFSGSYFDCGSEDYPAVYADLTKFIKWIKNTIKN